MMKKLREGVLINIPELENDNQEIDITSGFNPHQLKRMSELGISNRGKRALLTKSAHLTTLPLDNLNSLSPNEQQKYNVLKPYFPYSAKLPTSPTRQNRVQNLNLKHQQPTLWKWKTDPSSNANGYRSDYAYSRVRAQSHKTPKPESGSTKSMPFLVPRTAHQSKISNKLFSSLSPDQNADKREKKVPVKSKPQSAMSTSSSQQTTQTQNINEKYGEMVMKGSGKAPGIITAPVSLAGSKVQVSRERVQVCRSKEEKEKNPESIRLDKNGLRIFPDIGGGESVTLKLLSLQHNLITRLENVPLLSQLVVLDLYDNRIERISGLQGLPSLRVLLLGKNRIKRIEGLESLKRLEILDLHGNQLRYVDNLGPLISLRVLNLAGNLLRNIRNLGPYGMASLTELNLKRNRIKNLEGLQKAPHLKRLLIANNELQNISSLAPLRKLLFLRDLVIEPNPLVTSSSVGSDYCNQILTLFPSLTTLDRNVVTEEMKCDAKIWHKKKITEEEMRKQEEARLRDEMNASVGPPGSREQVIYQARRRWESLKNYVKSSNSPSNDNPKPKTKPIKSMKSAVKAATNERLKASSALYPPATLDLETFPDGHSEFDKTESLLGIKNNTTDEEQNVISQNHQRPFTLPTCPSLEKVLEVSSDEVADNLLSPVTPNYDKTQNNDTFDRNQHNAFKNEELPVGSYETLLTGHYSPEVLDATKAISELTLAKIELNCNISTNGLNSGNDNPVGNDYDLERESFSKVAVVRPLLREDCVSESKNPLQAVETKPSEQFTSSIAIPFSESSPYNFSNNKQNESVNKPINEVPERQVQLCIKEDDPKSFLDKVDTNHVTQDDSTVNIATTGSTNLIGKSGNVRSKLLKHLRSISLDSYPHQLLRQEEKVTKPEDAESTMSYDDDDGDDVEDEDEDNDNEVQDYDCDADDAFSSTTTGTSISTPRKGSTSAILNKSSSLHRKQMFPRTKSQRIKLRERAAKLLGEATGKISSATTTKRINSGTGSRATESHTSLKQTVGSRMLRRCDSAISLSTASNATSIIPQSSSKIMTTLGTNGTITGNEIENTDGSSSLKKQGEDFLVEIDGKVLNVFGQGGLRHAVTAFTPNVTCHVCTAKFHYISFDSIIPFFGKLRQVFPALEHFHFRANNICTLAQLDALSDLQGLFSLVIAKEGNPIVAQEAWSHYASYRLSHWGLQAINGKEVCSEYRGGITPTAQAREFESLGFLALSCLPQTALTPLAKRLHMLHCFCCCSPSTSSDESNKPQKFLAANAALNNHGRVHSPLHQQSDHGSTTSFCTAWDDDPVLLDVIGKEALVYCPPPLSPEDNNRNSESKEKHLEQGNSREQPEAEDPSSNSSASVFEQRRAETLGNLMLSGVEIVEKVDKLEKIWPTLMTEVIQEMLMDFRFMDNYMKKELKKAYDITLISHQHHSGQHHHQTGRKNRH